MNSRRFRVISIPISYQRETAHQQAIELGRISQRATEPFTTRQLLTPLHRSPVGVKTRTPSSALILGCCDAHSTSESEHKPTHATAKNGQLLHNRVSTQQHGSGPLKAKGLGSLEIDGELILGWGLCWSGAVTMIARNNRLINADAAPFLKFPR
jgi:hypothetical protein